MDSSRVYERENKEDLCVYAFNYKYRIAGINCLDLDHWLTYLSEEYSFICYIYQISKLIKNKLNINLTLDYNIFILKINYNKLRFIL